MAKKVLDGKIAVVTGGGTGIGRAIARRFVGEGASVVIAGRDVLRLNEVAKAESCHAIGTDMSRESEVASLFDQVGNDFGRLDILVNNAGIAGPVANADAMDIAAWDETMAINVRGTILGIKYAVPLMRRGGGGSIVNMSSLMGLRGTPMRSAYTASKFAIIGITDAVAQEVGIDNIRVNSLCPGAVNGELMQRVIAARSAAEGRLAEEVIRMYYTDKSALRRWVEPEEVAQAALFLATAGSITGERLRVDAGRF
jgi:NAD(P)-dependent dehydrogenase (short-subunit alcohol dehydrogenase family)